VRRSGALLLPALVAAVVGLAPAAGAEPPPKTLKLGVLGGMFRDVPPDVIQVVSSPFRDLFKKHTGLGGDVEVVDDCHALADKLDAKKVQLGLFHGFEWAWVKDRHPDLKPVAVTVPHKRAQACIVVNAKSTAAEPADLAGAEVVVPNGTKVHCDLYLARVRQDLPAGACKPVKQDVWADDALDAVGKGKATAALVDAGVLAAYQNNVPGKGNLLRVLAQSDPFPPAVLVCHKDGLDAKTEQRIRAGLLSTKDDPKGRAFLLMWKLKGFEAAPAGFDDDLRRTREAYPPPKPEKVSAPK
jgi:ABC-type phosphate/phosphonate transport system substrate-binding protein